MFDVDDKKNVGVA